MLERELDRKQEKPILHKSGKGKGEIKGQGGAKQPPIYKKG